MNEEPITLDSLREQAAAVHWWVVRGQQEVAFLLSAAYADDVVTLFGPFGDALAPDEAADMFCPFTTTPGFTPFQSTFTSFEAGDEPEYRSRIDRDMAFGDV